MKNTSFRDYIIEDVLGHIDGITTRGMFSGWAVYLDGVVVGLISEGEFYLKADKELVLKYKKEGLYPFTYTKNDGKMYEMAYVNVPIETLEDRDSVRERVMESYEISMNSSKRKVC